MQGNVRGQSGGGFDIQGIWNEYMVAAGENISAGDFVEFIKKVTSQSSSMIGGINVGSHDYYDNVSAVKLTDTRIFVACGNQYTSAGQGLLGIVCDIQDNTVNITNYTLIESTSYTIDRVSTVLLSENKVFIVYNRNSGLGGFKGVICSIGQSSITNGTITVINTESYSCAHISSVAISEDTVFIAHSSSTSSKYLAGTICTINGNVITAGTATTLYNSKEKCGNTSSAIFLSENKILIVHPSGYSSSTSENHLIGTICTISGNNITVNVNTELNAYIQGISTLISTVMVSKNKIAIIFSKNYSTGYLHGIVCLIDNTTITSGVDTELNSNSRIWLSFIVSIIIEK